MIKKGGPKLTVNLRQQLQSESQVEQFCTELASTLEGEVRAGRKAAFDDFDLSQSVVPAEGFDEIFLQLTIAEASIERFKAFGCPAFDDSAVSKLAEWISHASSQAMPSELHLSDCAITAEGFGALAKALEDSEVLPVRDPHNPGRTLPIYVRLEHNYIDEEAMKAKAEEGVMVTWKKTDPIPQDPLVKWRLVLWDQGQFSQHRHVPPKQVQPPAQAATSAAPKPALAAPLPVGQISRATGPAAGGAALAVPGPKEPTVAKPVATKRVMAPKVAQAQPPPEPPQQATPRIVPVIKPALVPPKQSADQEQPRKWEPLARIVPPSKSAGKTPAAVPPKNKEPRDWEPLARPTPQQPQSVKPKQHLAVRPPKQLTPRPAAASDADPHPPRFPPPAGSWVSAHEKMAGVSAREKMVAAPKMKMRAAPY